MASGSSNPFWFGYYPGQRPIYKRGPAPITPININLNENTLDQMVDQFGYSIKDAIDSPKSLFWDNYWKDFTSSMKASSFGLYSPDVNLNDIDSDEVTD